MRCSWDPLFASDSVHSSFGGGWIVHLLQTNELPCIRIYNLYCQRISFQIVHFVPREHGRSVVESLRAVRPTAFYATPYTYDHINDMLLHGNSRGQMSTDVSDTASVMSHQSVASQTSMRSGMTAATFGGTSQVSQGSTLSRMSFFGKKKTHGTTMVWVYLICSTMFDLLNDAICT
jgi:hypothetical protein